MRVLSACGRIMVAAAFLIVGSVVVSAETAVSSAQAVAQDTIVVDSDDARVTITLETEPGEVAGMLVDPVLRRMSDGSTVAARWELDPAGTEATAGQPLRLPVGQSVLMLSARLPGPGLYEAAFRLSDAQGAISRRVVLRLERLATALPSDFLPATLAVDLTSPPVPFGHFGYPPIFAVAVTGRTDAPLSGGAAGLSVGALVRQGADGAAGPAVPPEKIARESDCNRAMAPGDLCTITLGLPRLAPGSYRLDLAVSGAAGGASASALTLQVRGSAVWAGALIGLGALLAGVVQHWRTVDKTALIDRLPLALLREDAATLAASAPGPVRARLQAVADRVTNLLQDSRYGAALPATARDDLRAELTALRGAHAALSASGTLDPAGRGIIAPPEAALTTSLSATPWQAAATGTAAADLTAALDALPALSAASQALREGLAKLLPALALPGKDLAPADQNLLLAAEISLRDAAQPAASAAVIGKRTGALAGHLAGLADLGSRVEAILREREARRIAALDEALRADASLADTLAAGLQELELPVAPGDFPGLIRRHAELKRLERAAGGTETQATAPDLPPDVSAADLPPALDIVLTPGLLLPPPEAGSAAINARIAGLDLLTNLIVAALIGAGGVLVLWAGNATWGSYADSIGALLAGVGTRLAIPAVRLPATT